MKSYFALASLLAFTASGASAQTTGLRVDVLPIRFDLSNMKTLGECARAFADTVAAAKTATCTVTLLDNGAKSVLLAFTMADGSHGESQTIQRADGTYQDAKSWRVLSSTPPGPLNVRRP